MDNSFDRVSDRWMHVDLAMEKVEEAPFYTEEAAKDLLGRAEDFLNAVKLWRHLHGDD